MEEKINQVKTLYNKHQLEKQVSCCPCVHNMTIIVLFLECIHLLWNQLDNLAYDYCLVLNYIMNSFWGLHIKLGGKSTNPSHVLLVIFLQANKNISFGRLEVHEIAAFVLNSSGHYEAITRNCSNYYLSTESVALFVDHLPSRPNYIVGKIVHIEQQIVKASPSTLTRPEHGKAGQLTSDMGTDRLTLNSWSASNLYCLPLGCEFFVVTVAMLPDTTLHSPSPS